MNVFTLFCLLAAAVVQDGNPVDPATGEDASRAAIASAVEAYVEAFNARDADKLAQCWAEQATYVLPESGETLVGRQAIRDMFAEMFTASETPGLAVTIENLRFITPDVAVESGLAQVKQADGTVEESRYSAIHVKQGDRWVLDSIHDMAETAAAPEIATTPLAELDWMVGEWVEESEDSTSETTCQWTTNNSFLTRTFRIAAPGENVFEGTQVIGWDPIAGELRSWVFDSDGGFSEGSWKRKGDSWVVDSSGFAPDGRPVRSVQVYTFVDANTFTWQSFGRRVGDEALPDLEEVRVVRK